MGYRTRDGDRGYGHTGALGVSLMLIPLEPIPTVDGQDTGGTG